MSTPSILSPIFNILGVHLYTAFEPGVTLCPSFCEKSKATVKLEPVFSGWLVTEFEYSTFTVNTLLSLANNVSPSVRPLGVNIIAGLFESVIVILSNIASIFPLFVTVISYSILSPGDINFVLNVF